MLEAEPVRFIGVALDGRVKECALRGLKSSWVSSVHNTPYQLRLMHSGVFTDADIQQISLEKSAYKYKNKWHFESNLCITRTSQCLDHGIRWDWYSGRKQAWRGWMLPRVLCYQMYCRMFLVSNWPNDEREYGSHNHLQFPEIGINKHVCKMTIPQVPRNIILQSLFPPRNGLIQIRNSTMFTTFIPHCYEQTSQIAK